MLVLILFSGGSAATGWTQELSSLEAEINPELLREAWPAEWIAHPEADGEAFGVFHFRRTFDLEEVPDSFLVHTSADNRYELFVNGERVEAGPSRGDLAHWRFETTDLAPYLNSGENTLAAVVWNFAEHRPVAQIIAVLIRIDGDSRSVRTIQPHRWPRPIRPRLQQQQSDCPSLLDAAS